MEVKNRWRTIVHNEWSLQGVKVKPEFVMSSTFESIIRIPNASKDMSGLLRVIAKNKLGQAESSMHFIVVDLPAPFSPTKPMTVPWGTEKLTSFSEKPTKLLCKS